MSDPRSNTKLVSRDLITIAIFSVLFTLCLFVVAGVLGIFPLTMIFYGLVGGIPCGVIYMYMRAKTPKRGAIILQALLVAIILFGLGTMWTFALGTVIGGLLAEAISTSGAYQSLKKNTAGYIVFMVCLWSGQIAPMLLMRDYYLAYSLQTGMSAEYIDTMLGFLSAPVFMAALIGTGIGAWLGALLGQKLLKKHFERAGML